MLPRRLPLALALATPLRAQGTAPKLPIRGLVSMGAYRFVGAGGEPANTLAPSRRSPGSSAGS